MNNIKKRNWIVILILAIKPLLFIFGVFGVIWYFFYQTEIPPAIPTVVLTQVPSPTSTIPATPSPLPTFTKQATISPTPTAENTFTPEPIPTLTQTPTATFTNLPDLGHTHHEVQPGEYLTGISLDFYGTGRRWNDIYEATNARAREGYYREIKDPNLIFPDDWLVIPIVEDKK